MGEDRLVEIAQQGVLGLRETVLQVGELVGVIVLDLIDEDVTDVAVTLAASDQIVEVEVDRNVAGTDRPFLQVVLDPVDVGPPLVGR